VLFAVLVGIILAGMFGWLSRPKEDEGYLAYGAAVVGVAAAVYCLSWTHALLPRAHKTICDITGATEVHFLAYVTKDEMKAMRRAKGRGTASKGLMGSQGVPCFPADRRGMQWNISPYRHITPYTREQVASHARVEEQNAETLREIQEETGRYNAYRDAINRHRTHQGIMLPPATRQMRFNRQASRWWQRYGDPGWTSDAEARAFVRNEPSSPTGVAQIGNPHHDRAESPPDPLAN
jgi:hypothetical protein